MENTLELLKKALHNNEDTRYWALDENKDKALGIASNRIKEAIKIIEAYNN